MSFAVPIQMNTVIIGVIMNVAFNTNAVGCKFITHNF